MKIEVAFEMRRGDREWVGSVIEMTVNTIAQAQKWVEGDVKRKAPGLPPDTEIDVVSLSEVGEFYDDEGEPMRTRYLGQFVPINNEWEWSHALSS